METLNKNEGLITQIIGPVIDVEFAQGELPEIYNALKIYKEDGSYIAVSYTHLRRMTIAETARLAGVSYNTIYALYHDQTAGDVYKRQHQKRINHMRFPAERRAAYKNYSRIIQGMRNYTSLFFIRDNLV